MNQQLYAVGQQVNGNMPDEFKNSTLILGGFYYIMCYIARMGKIGGSAGLLDLLVDPNIYAGATAGLMLV